MGNLFLILIVLFVVLIVVITLVERFGKPMSDEETSKISRFVLPLFAVLAVIQIIYLMTR